MTLIGKKEKQDKKESAGDRFDSIKVDYEFKTDPVKNTLGEIVDVDIEFKEPYSKERIMAHLGGFFAKGVILTGIPSKDGRVKKLEVRRPKK